MVPAAFQSHDRPLRFGRNIQGLALVDDMDGEKLERFVAGNRKRPVRNVTNVDLGGARLERDRLALRRDGGGAAYGVNGLFGLVPLAWWSAPGLWPKTSSPAQQAQSNLSASSPEPRFAILDRKRLGSVSNITYALSNVAMFPQSMGGHDAQKLTNWTKHSDCQLHAVVRPQLSGQASF
jgi:hypothetical protein